MCHSLGEMAWETNVGLRLKLVDKGKSKEICGCQKKIIQFYTKMYSYLLLHILLHWHMVLKCDYYSHEALPQCCWKHRCQWRCHCLVLNLVLTFLSQHSEHDHISANTTSNNYCHTYWRPCHTCITLCWYIGMQAIMKYEDRQKHSEFLLKHQILAMFKSMSIDNYDAYKWTSINCPKIAYYIYIVIQVFKSDGEII